MPLLEVASVSKSYRRRHGIGSGRRGSGKSRSTAVTAISDISLSIGKGQSLGIVGESGAGKSTLAMLACGLEKQSNGTILLDGQPAQSLDRKQRTRVVQMIWQDARGSLDPLIRIATSIAEPLKLHGLGDSRQIDERIESLLEEVGLSPALKGRYPHELSGGEVQRVVIARALALEPRLLICDEPASALDVRIKAQVAELLNGLRKRRGMALMIIAHDLMLVRKMTDEVAVMFAGSILEKGPTSEVLDNPLHPYTRMLIDSESIRPFHEMNHEDEALPASPPDLVEEETGCLFNSRCARAEQDCMKGRPRLAVSGEEREVACAFPLRAG